MGRGGIPPCWTATSPATPWSASSPTRPDPGRPAEEIADEAFAIFNDHPRDAAGAELACAYYGRRLRSLSAGDVVAVGDVLLAVGRPAGWEPVIGPLTEVRTREHGTNPLPDPSWLPGAGTRAAQVPAIRPGAACGSRSPGRPSGTEGEPA